MPCNIVINVMQADDGKYVVRKKYIMYCKQFWKMRLPRPLAMYSSFIYVFQYIHILT